MPISGESFLYFLLSASKNFVANNHNDAGKDSGFLRRGSTSNVIVGKQDTFTNLGVLLSVFSFDDHDDPISNFFYDIILSLSL